MKTPLIVDIETDGRPAQVGRLLLVGWQPADQDKAHVCIPPRPGDDAEHDLCFLAMQDALADPERPVVSMTKFDPRYLRLQGWDVQGPFWDLQVMGWVLNENQQLSLDALAKRYLGLSMDKRLSRSAGVVYFKCDCGKRIPLVEMAFGMPGAECHWARFERYCVEDVEAETRLFNTLTSRLTETAWLDYFLEEEAPFTESLVDMECSGLPVNLVDSESLRARLEVEAEDSRSRLLTSASLPPGFNVNSGDHLAGYLYEKTASLKASLTYDVWTCEALKSCLADEHDDCEEYTDYDDPVPGHVTDLLPERFTLDTVGRTQVHGRFTYKGRDITPTTKTDSGKRWSTASPVLRSNLNALTDEWVLDLLQYRKVEKVLTTYLRPFPALAQEGRLYGRFNQTGTKTGRLSSSEPNLQNIPARGPLGEAVRGLFQGLLLVGDESQLEPRLLAHFSQDPVLLEVYRTEADIYNVTGSAIFGVNVEKGMDERDISKVVFLGDQYGMGKDKLAATLTMNGFVTTPETAKGYQDELHALYRVAELWKQDVRASVRQKGYVATIGGRHRRLKAAFEDRRNWKNIGYGERQAVNAIIQGSAGDIVRRTMVAAGAAFPRIRLLAQVHDELVWEVPDSLFGDETLLTDVTKLAEEGHGYDLSVPLVFEPHFGTSWFAAKEGIELPEDILEETDGFEEE